MIETFIRFTVLRDLERRNNLLDVLPQKGLVIDHASGLNCA